MPRSFRFSLVLVTVFLLFSFLSSLNSSASAYCFCFSSPSDCVAAGLDTCSGQKCCDPGTCDTSTLTCSPTISVIPTPRHPAKVIPTWAPIMPALVPCTKTRGVEFHPLRPYPANACDPLIPRKTPEAIKNLPNRLYLTFQCGKSANPKGTYNVSDVVKLGYDIISTNYSSVPLIEEGGTRSKDYFCQAGSGEICFVKQIRANVALNFKETQFPILGNTQDFLTDTQRVNRYLSWYLEGAIQQSDHVDLNTNLPEDNNRIVTFAGPIKKLLSRESQLTIHDTMQHGKINSDYHNYIVIDISGSRMTDVGVNHVNLPLSSLEDITGEVTTSVVSSGQPQSPEIDGQIISIGPLTIGAADSRLYFPHLKETNALAQILASTFKPDPTGIPPAPTPIMTEPNPIDVSDSNLLSQYIAMHQGPPAQVPRGADDTVVQTVPKVNNEVVRNTELREGAVAPKPLYAAPSIKCDITPVRTNAGDDLMGSVINTTLVYRQLFRYFPQLVISTANAEANILDVEVKIQGSCVEENGQCSGVGDCCWGECPKPESYCAGGGECDGLSPLGCSQTPGCSWYGLETEECCVCDGTCSDLSALYCEVNGCTWGTPPPPPTYCPSWPHKDLKSKAYISVYAKIPFVDRIYDTLIAGPQSILRRFLPGQEILNPSPSPVFQYGKFAAESAKAASGNAVYTGSSPDLSNFSVDAGSGGGGMLYFPRVGSILDHFLGDGSKYTDENIQCFFRPQTKGGCGTHNVVCDDFESKLTESGDGECGVCNSPMGELARKILAQAGKTYNVSAANIYAAMKHEGGDWDVYNGFANDEEVRKWSVSKICGGEDMPKCNNDEPATQAPFGFIRAWFYKGDGDYASWNAVTKFLPERNSRELVSRCNFIDAAFAAAKLLSMSAARTDLTEYIPSNTCGPYTFVDNVRPDTCSWTDTKVAQSQVYYGGQCYDLQIADKVPYDTQDVVGWYHQYSCGG